MLHNELNATCEVCGTKYHICKKCILLRNNGIDNWRLHCDKAVCYQILTVVDEYKKNNLDKQEAKEQLIGLVDGVDLVGGIKYDVDDIIGNAPVNNIIEKHERENDVEDQRHRRRRR